MWAHRVADKYVRIGWTSRFRVWACSVGQGSFVAILGHNGCGTYAAKHFNASFRRARYGMDTKDEEQLLAIPAARRHGLYRTPDNHLDVVEEDVALRALKTSATFGQIRRRRRLVLRAVGHVRNTGPSRRSCSPRNRSSVWPSRGVLAMQPTVSCSTSRLPRRRRGARQPSSGSTR